MFNARLGKQGKHFTLRYDQSIFVVSLSQICNLFFFYLSSSLFQRLFYNFLIRANASNYNLYKQFKGKAFHQSASLPQYI